MTRELFYRQRCRKVLFKHFAKLHPDDHNKGMIEALAHLSLIHQQTLENLRVLDKVLFEKVLVRFRQLKREYKIKTKEITRNGRK